jgi:hypothetical protein
VEVSRRCGEKGDGEGGWGERVVGQEWGNRDGGGFVFSRAKPGTLLV